MGTRGDGDLLGSCHEVRRLELPLTPEEPVFAYEASRPADPAPRYDVHSACEVGLVLEGEYLRIYEGLERRVPAGQLWLCGVWEPHGSRTLESPTRALIITFLLDFLLDESPSAPPWGRLFLSHSSANRSIDLSDAESRHVSSCAREVLAECAAERPYRDEAARLALRQLLLPILRRSDAEAPLDRSAANFARVEQVIRMVGERMPAAFTVADAARAAKLSRSRFCDVFRRATGVSFGEFVQRARIARAAQELASTDLKIAAVARRWGYFDQSHMHRAFRRFFRCTPAEYRAQGAPGPVSLDRN